MSCVYLSPLLTVLFYPPAVSQPRAGTRSCECAFLLPTPGVCTVYTHTDSDIHTLAARVALGCLYARRVARRGRRTPAGARG